MANLIEQLQVGTNAEISAAENGERAAFRDLLIAEIAAMRQSIKEYNAESETVQKRLNTAVAQTLVPRATIEITEKRIASVRNATCLASNGNPPSPSYDPKMWRIGRLSWRGISNLFILSFWQ